MSPILAVSTGVAVLAIIGLVVGLVVLLLVIYLLQSTLAPLRAVLTDVKSAQTAPMLERGVPGTEQLDQTRRLAESVPALALAYLGKLNGGARPAAPAPPPAFPTPGPAAQQQPSDANLPGWQRFQARS
jgi:hypothetical protein